MVKPLQYRPQSVGEAGLRSGTNTVFSQKAQNLAGLNSAFQDITDPIAESILGGEAEADRLKKYDAEKDLPVELIPPDESGFNPLSLTKWGKAYDKSYNELDAQLISFKAQEALAENAFELSKLENQGPGITRQFEDNAAKIITTYANSAKPANRTKLQTTLTEFARNKEFQIAQTEYKHGVAEAKAELDAITSTLNDQLFEAARNDDEAEILRISRELESNYNSQANLGFIPHAEAEAQKRQVASKARESLLFGKAMKAKSEGTEDEFIADLVLHPENHNVTVKEAYGAAKSIMQVRDFEDKAKADAKANEYAIFDYGIDIGSVTSEDEIINTNYLDVPEKLRLMSKLNDAQQKQQKQAYDNANAVIEISEGRAASLPAKQTSSMFDEALNRTKDMLGPNVTIMERAQILDGTGNVYPASGVRDLSLGTNVASFDRTLRAGLLSRDPNQVVQSALAYNYLVNTKKQPNLVKLEGKELLMAIETSNLLNIGVDPLTAVKIAEDSILNVTDYDREERVNTFKSEEIRDQLPSFYQETFGVESNQNDGSFTAYTNILRGFYIKSGSIDTAKQATANVMRHYGPSDDFPPGEVMNFRPDDLPIKQIGYAYNNQKIYALQNAIDENAAQRLSEGKKPYSDKIEWEKPGFRADIEGKTAEELVVLPFLRETKIKDAQGNDIAYSIQRPRLKITPTNGTPYITDVFLRTSTQTALGQPGRPIYDFWIYDASGNLTPLSSAKNQATGNAQFSPATLKEWAPEIYNEENKLLFDEGYNQILNAPIKELIKQGPSKEGLLKSLNVKRFKDFAIEIKRELDKRASPELKQQVYDELERLYNEDES